MPRSATTQACVLAALASAAGTSAAPLASAACAPVKPAGNLNLTEWARKTWYVQQQQLNGYQTEKDLYCVLASYDVSNKTVPFFKGTVIAVHNFQRAGNVNGKPGNTDKNIPSGLCARQTNSLLPAGLLVAPCFLPNLAGGPYWIVAFGTDPATGEYTWGAVSGGAPTEQYPDGCTTKEKGINDSGLWIFGRQRVVSNATLTEARSALTKLGFTLQLMRPVVQIGCNYTGATIK